MSKWIRLLHLGSSNKAENVVSRRVALVLSIALSKMRFRSANLNSFDASIFVSRSSRSSSDTPTKEEEGELCCCCCCKLAGAADEGEVDIKDKEEDDDELAKLRKLLVLLE